MGPENEAFCILGINRLVLLGFGRGLALSVLAKFCKGKEFQFMGKAVLEGREQIEPAECVEELARFFPGVVQVRIPVKVCKGRSGKATSSEESVIEFGTLDEVLFVSSLPLDFEDIVRVKSADGSLDIVAKIIAMHLYHDKMAIAAKFLEDVPNWIIKADGQGAPQSHSRSENRSMKTKSAAV
jgi:hypothetical protein